MLTPFFLAAALAAAICRFNSRSASRWALRCLRVSLFSSMFSAWRASAASMLRRCFSSPYSSVALRFATSAGASSKPSLILWAHWAIFPS